MRVKVLFFGQLKDIVGAAEDEVRLDDHSTLGQLFDRYAANHPRLAALRASVVLARNREFAGPAEALADGDEVAFLPPVSGGTGEPVRSTDRPERPEGQSEATEVAIVRAPIDTRELVARLARGEDGAVVTFEGITRNNSGGRATLFLEYEAYEPMALAQMRELAAEIRRRWPVDRVGLVHRLGRLEIGEASVVIVVTSAHRGPAFEACRYAIDRLKKTVPIWKKEHFTDGAVWVEGDWDLGLLAGSVSDSEPPRAEK